MGNCVRHFQGHCVAEEVDWAAQTVNCAENCAICPSDFNPFLTGSNRKKKYCFDFHQEFAALKEYLLDNNINSGGYSNCTGKVMMIITFINCVPCSLMSLHVALQAFIFYSLCLCSGGFLLLVAYWKPDWSLQMKCSACPLHEASYILLKVYTCTQCSVILKINAQYFIKSISSIPDSMHVSSPRTSIIFLNYIIW